MWTWEHLGIKGLSAEEAEHLGRQYWEGPPSRRPAGFWRCGSEVTDSRRWESGDRAAEEGVGRTTEDARCLGHVPRREGPVCSEKHQALGATK